MGNDTRATKRVLFVCGGNTCRSPMAAAIARQLLGPAADVRSAGIYAVPDAPAALDAIVVMAERGLDIRGHRARSIHDVDPTASEYVVALTPAIARELRSLRVDPATIIELCILDPFGQGIDIYRETADDITRELQRIFGARAEG